MQYFEKIFHLFIKKIAWTWEKLILVGGIFSTVPKLNQKIYIVGVL